MYNSLSWTTGRSLVAKYLKEADKLQRNPSKKGKKSFKKKSTTMCLVHIYIWIPSWQQLKKRQS